MVISKKRKKQFIWIAICFGLFFIPLSLVALEVGLRTYIHFKYGKPGRNYGIYQEDNELGATHRPNSYNTNSELNNFGLRTKEDVPDIKPAKSLRIYCSGGSTTFCYNLETENAWPSKLQNKLRAINGHSEDQVLNGGQICFSISHEYTLGSRLIPQLKPDIVLIFTGVNEGMSAEQLNRKSSGYLDYLYQEKKWGEVPKDLDQARFWKRNSAVVRLWDYYIKKWLEKTLTSKYKGPDTPSPEPVQVNQEQQSSRNVIFHPYVMANFETCLKNYIDLIKSNGAIPIIIRYGDNGSKNWYMEKGTRVWRDKAVEIGNRLGVTICDASVIYEKLGNRNSYFIESGIHVTDSGAEILAEELVKTILKEAKKDN